MAKKARLPINPKPASQRPAWIGFAVTALVAAVCGAAISAAIRPNAALLKPASPTVAGIPVAAPADSPTPSAVAVAPPPELILDLPPAKAALNLANWSYDQKNWANAIVYYREAIKRGFSSPDVLTDMGNAYRFSGQPQKALEQYALAQKTNPAHETSLFNEGDVYATDLGDVQHGLGAWKQYLKRFPDGVHRDEARHLIEVTEAHSGINTSNAAATPNL